MVRMRVVYEGGLRCDVMHTPSGSHLSTDAPVDNHGRGESFSPTDLVASAMGSCMLTVMGIVAERHGWNMKGATVDVEKGMVREPVRRIGRLTVVIRVPGEFDESKRRVLERAAMACPVHASLHPDVDVPVRFEWQDVPV